MLLKVLGLFEREIPDAISSARLLELYPNWPTGGTSTPFMAKYIFDRTMADHANNSNLPSIIHHTVKSLLLDEQVENTESNEQRRAQYTRTLCDLAVSKRSCRDQWTIIHHLRQGSLDGHESNRDLTNLLRHTPAAAAFFGKNNMVVRILGEEKSIFGAIPILGDSSNVLAGVGMMLLYQAISPART